MVIKINLRGKYFGVEDINCFFQNEVVQVIFIK